ncbi:hypothetical protein GMLC_36400 [Geomonas limicola]|uniref:DUF4082 domain-containing protein n=1 Tax=Geomonas limicola TaxID=2740186 RepID=A0A6V8NC13_9BACT|nr:DUF4082 domain-containing protein [Geomonas limicola]GFO70061.1 hypothetical protein GMLC_36400 [Geomonas limicola]
MKALRIFAALVFWLAGMAGLADASTLAGTPSAGGWYFPGGGGTVGYEFRSSQAFMVTGLGVADYYGNGLTSGRPIGLFDMNGNLLASATVPAGTVSPKDANGYRWVDLATPYTLLSDTDYMLAAFYADSDPFASFASVNAPFTVESAWYTEGSALSMPNIAFDVGFFGRKLRKS